MMAKQLVAIQKTLKDYSGTLFNTAIIGSTAAVEKIVSVAAFRCPCVSLVDLGSDCQNLTKSSSDCTKWLNSGYGISFIIAPAMGLYMFGIVSSPQFWKSLTGCAHKTQEHKREAPEAIWTLCSIAGKALLSPFTWICIAFLNGIYFACATTAVPYDVERDGAKYSDCEAVARDSRPTMSDAFNDNISLSQLLGWIITAVSIVIGLTVYAATQCSFPLTYYHAKYYKLYREAEEAQFDEEMKKKAEKDAEENVLKFMDEQREKNLWDKISTVYEFHRDKKHLALYSHLHEWVVEITREQSTNMELETNVDKLETNVDETLEPMIGSSAPKAQSC